MKKLFTRIFFCFLAGIHDWTWKAREGIKPSEDEIRLGIIGFQIYGQMYCKRCGKISKYNLL